MNPNIKILAVYKYLEQVVIYEDETGTHVKAFMEDEGTEEEQKAIRDLVLSSGFQVNNTKVIKVYEESKQEKARADL